MSLTLTNWTGHLDDLAFTASRLLRAGGRKVGDLSPRLIRDYLRRGIVGMPGRSGRSLEFNYEHLVRLIAARILLADGWPLAKIADQLSTSTLAEVLALVPRGLLHPQSSDASEAMNAIARIRAEFPDHLAPKLGDPDQDRTFRRRAADLTRIQSDLKDALQRLGLPDGRVATENLTLFAIATWCQVLVETDRMRSITVEEAEELGRALTLSLLHLNRQKGPRS